MQIAVGLLPYLGLGISLIVFLGLFCGIAQKVEKLRGRVAKLEKQIEHGAELYGLFRSLASRVEELESGAPAGANPPGAPSSLNGTVRSKVLKMHRLGQPVDRIADNLRVPKGEVDLLVKVHQIVMRPYEQAPLPAGDAEAS